MLPTQQKALLLESKGGPLVVNTIAMPQPGPGEVLARVEAAALNPIDWKLQAFGMFVAHYPSLFGNDGAGVVVELGEGVTSFAVGDRIAWQSSLDLVNKKILQGTFLQYAKVPTAAAMKIPANVPLDAAASMPCTLPTAAFPLYNQSEAASSVRLTAPWVEGGRGKYAGKSGFVMGGSTSVGQFVIQLLRLSGFSPIVTVASARHEEYLKSLGATHVVDRYLAADALKAAVTAPVAGLGGVFDIVYDAVCTAETVSLGLALTAAEGDFIYASPAAVALVPAERGSKKVHGADGLSSAEENRELHASLAEALPKLLEVGDLKPNRVEVLPGGLHAVTEGLTRVKAGKVSGTKLVVLPQETTA